MKTITLKMPEVLEAKLNSFAKSKGQSKSEIIRNALMLYISNENISLSGSFLDLSEDLAGSIDGPKNLSTNKSLFKGYGE